MLSEIKTVLKQNMINREAYKKWVVVGLYCLCFLYSTAAIIFHCMLSAIDAAFGAVFLNTSLWNNKVRNSKKKELELSCDADFGPPVRSCVIRDFQVKTCKHHE